jgi:hypothetical protein
MGNQTSHSFEKRVLHFGAYDNANDSDFVDLVNSLAIYCEAKGGAAYVSAHVDKDEWSAWCAPNLNGSLSSKDPSCTHANDQVRFSPHFQVVYGRDLDGKFGSIIVTWNDKPGTSVEEIDWTMPQKKTPSPILSCKSGNSPSTTRRNSNSAVVQEAPVDVEVTTLRPRRRSYKNPLSMLRPSVYITQALILVD